MKKLLLLTLLTLAVFSVNAQDDYFNPKQKASNQESKYVPNDHEKAGIELQTAANHYQTGTGLMIGGGVIAFLSSTIKISTSDNGSVNSSKKQMLNIGGGAMVLVGFILQVESFSHIRKAGLLLNKNGIGIAVKL